MGVPQIIRCGEWLAGIGVAMSAYGMTTITVSTALIAHEHSFKHYLFCCEYHL